MSIRQVRLLHQVSRGCVKRQYCLSLDFTIALVHQPKVFPIKFHNISVLNLNDPFSLRFYQMKAANKKYLNIMIDQ